MTAAEPLRGPAPEGTPAPRPRGEHRYDIDLVRVLASVGVIVCHAAGELMKSVDRDPSGGGPVYWTALVGDALSRCAVPLFFAIAGWVVLSGAPPRDGGQVRRRLTRIVVPMAVWTAVYLLWDRVRDANAEPTRDLAWDALFGSVRPAFHLWYLYAYVPVVLLLSVVLLIRAGKRPWGAGAVLLGLALAPTLLGDLARLLDVERPPFAWQFGVYQIVYAVAGALLLSLPGAAVTGRGRRLLWLAGGLCAWGAVAVYEHRVHFPGPYASVVVALLAGTLLMALNRIRVPERFRPLLGRLAGVSFGAYLVHLLFLEALAPRVVSADAGWPGAVGGLVGLTVATVVLSFAAALLWTRLRLGRWLG
ncbi:putative integral membrane protein [Streptomyces ambofaciens ATCC 23877]|uniref:Putative integral membrane protein n=1 Tax=Streptomyces ambofaciens (strain ATCC 23877 / 3486 / DSM 40053 / JCM 4204 / NBRC 12836 / NRRL B-2516) TaxID=278992 RepID=A0A0K2AXQ1_STRA7|nr:acyltransferase [Streptomyces ambofaciens]AKZ57738.1 putative integral membrane protein [Streptomyces ambofaciens ATCC 23877]